MADLESAVVLGAATSTVIGLPLGFLIGWKAGWKEHQLRCREDERAGKCGRCLQGLPPSQDRHDAPT